MPERHTHVEHHTLEVGGPGGVRIVSHSPGLVEMATPTTMPGHAMSLAARHSRAIAGGLALMGTILLVGPLMLVLALDWPLWMLVGPVVLALASVAAAVAVSRGVLLQLDRAQRHPELERQLLELATHTRGRLTVPITARLLSIPLSEAEGLLTSLVRSGHAEIDNDPETGAVLYLIPSLDQHR
jgi:hypothetical protein